MSQSQAGGCCYVHRIQNIVHPMAGVPSALCALLVVGVAFSSAAAAERPSDSGVRTGGSAVLSAGTVSGLTMAGVAALQQAATISGATNDSTGKPIAGVRVTLAELGIEAVSDIDGKYRFTEVRPGRYTLVARKIGFTSPSVTVTATSNEAVHDFVLTRSAQRLEPVTVTATSNPSDARFSSRSIGVLHQDELRNEASISLAHSLVNLPGVRSVSTGMQIGKPMIRGLYGARVLTLQDGMRLEDYSWSDEDAPSIDARLAQRVEVIRGPASVLYGSDALGGVVNVIPEALPTTAIGTRVRHTSVEAYGASNNLEGGASARVDGANGRVGWRLAGTGRFSGSIHTPVGEVAHTGLDATTFEGALGYRGEGSNSTLRFSLMGGEFQLLEANGPKSANGTPLIDSAGGPVRQLLDTRVQFVHNRVLGAVRLEAKAQWQRHSLKEVSDDCLPDVGQSECTTAQKAASKDKPAFDLLLNTSTIDLLAHHGGDGNLHGSVGVSALYQSNASSGPIYLVPTATTTSVGVYALEQVRLGILTLDGSARADHRVLSADANSQILLAANDTRTWNAATFNAGAVVQATPLLALVANIGSGWRAPTLFDLYTNGPNLAEARYEIGDYNLRREYDVTGEVGVRVTAARGRLEATAFQSRIDNYIYTSPTLQLHSGLPLFRHLQTDARFTGFEVSGSVEVAPPLSLNARYDYVQATNRVNDLPLPLIPPARAVVGATYRTGAVSWLKNLSLHGEVENVAQQTRLDASDLQTGSYTLVNLAASAEYPIAQRDVRFDLRVLNAGNVAYKDFLSRYKQFALAPGVNVVLRISTGW
ncbi:MAG: TonB-dependent receptor [Gemmatimonadota bacterium]|nr:TonB-dependent receptor [Gemmatimonadota bacterium]